MAAALILSLAVAVVHAGDRLQLTPRQTILKLIDICSRTAGSRSYRLPRTGAAVGLGVAAKPFVLCWNGVVRFDYQRANNAFRWSLFPLNRVNHLWAVWIDGGDQGLRR